jgi:SAM-dependent methyltransferase
MTEQGIRSARPWQEADFATEWVEADAVSEMLAFPRRIAAAVVAETRPATRKLVDIGSGSGEFLAVFLDEFPDATGVWTDASEAMRDIATRRLARYGDRVSYVMADMTDLASAGLPTDADVIMTSRAVHHLDRDGLFAFYRDAATHLAPGGWLVNLDHIGPRSDEWNTVLRAVRSRFRSSDRQARPHHHNYPLTGVADHQEALAGAGLTDQEIPWRALISVLFMARSAS